MTIWTAVNISGQHTPLEVGSLKCPPTNPQISPIHQPWIGENVPDSLGLQPNLPINDEPSQSKAPGHKNIFGQQEYPLCQPPRHTSKVPDGIQNLDLGHLALGNTLLTLSMQQHMLSHQCTTFVSYYQASQGIKWGKIGTAYNSMTIGSPWVTPSLLNKYSGAPWMIRTVCPQYVLKRNVEHYDYKTWAFHKAIIWLKELKAFVASTINTPQPEPQLSLKSSHMLWIAPLFLTSNPSTTGLPPHSSCTSNQVAGKITLARIQCGPLQYQ